MRLSRSFSIVLAMGMVLSALSVLSFDVRAETGGSDAFGYRWTDSDSPEPTVGFSWIEIYGSGFDTGLSGDDQSAGPFSIGFTFPFYENTYTDFYVSTNGLITFGSGSNDYINDPIPSANSPNNFLTPYWDDLYVESTSGVYYQMIGSSPNRQLVVEWVDVRELSDYIYMTFEAILNETGEIWFQYGWMGGNSGDDCTVGIENWDGSIGSLYSYDTGVLHDSLAIMFEIGPVSIGPSQATTLPPNWMAYYPMTVTNRMGITDSFDITCTSILGWSVLIYDASYALLPDTNGNGIPDTGDIPDGSSADIVVGVYIPPTPADPFETTYVWATSYTNPDSFGMARLDTTALQAEFSPPHDDYAYDEDSDGAYDYLIVGAYVQAYFSGTYVLEAYLYDSVWNYIGYAYAYVYLDIGLSQVELWFLGWQVYNSGDNGPYNVDMVLYGEYYNFLDYDSHQTNTYDWTTFEPPAAQFSPPHTDYGLDTNSDMLYNYLVVEVSVDVLVAGNYRINAYLYDPFWTTIGIISQDVYLDVGLQTVFLYFHGWYIRNNGVDGPYRVDLYLYDEALNMLDFDWHATQAYLYSDFQGPPVEFVPPHSDSGLDLNSDGLYDYLVVDAVVSVVTAGYYHIAAGLYDAGGWYITSSDNYSYLDLGTQVVQIWFDGLAIRSSGMDGPYQVYMDAADEDWNWIDSDLHWTGPYLWDDFQAQAFLSPPHSDYGIDVDSDSLYEYLAVDAVISVSEPGYYYVEASLYDPLYNFITYVYIYTDWLDAGTNVVQFLFPGYVISGYGVDGPYNVYLSLYNDYYEWLDSGWHTTNSYLYDEFAGPPAWFEPPHSDYGLDEDTNGLYDWLVVEVSVYVDLPGDYFVRGELYDTYGTYIDSYSEFLTLDAGLHTVELRFFGWYINSNGVDGPFTVELNMRDNWWNLVDSDTHTTNSYLYDAFEPFPAFLFPPHLDYGLDLDSDTLYDYLVVEVSVDVVTAGYFEVYGMLWDLSYMDLIAWMDTVVYLDVGIQTVDLMFTGWLIRDSGINGPYNVYLELYSGDGMYLDEDTHVTGTYYWYEFQGPPALFSPPHDDYGLDTDSNGLYEYLVVVAYVDVTTPGTYLVAAQLYDGVTYMVATNLTYLDTGRQAVEIKFNGWRLFGHGASGSYEVYLMLFTPDMIEIDYDWFMTNAYLFDDFEPTVPSLNSGWTFTPPTIDGQLSVGEWADATSLDMTTADPFCRLEGTLLVMNNATHLFIAYDVTGDTTEDDWDGATVGFDTGNDETFNDMGDDIFVVGYGEETLHANYLESADDFEIDCAPFDDTLADHAGLAGARGLGPSEASAADHRIYEMSMPLALIDAAPGEVLGFVAGSYYGYGIYDDSVGNFSSWPLLDTWNLMLTDFADLVLAALPDTTASLSGTMGLNDWYVSSVTVTLTAVDGMGGVDYTMYRVDGGSWLTYSAPFEVTTEGTHVVEFYSVDMAGGVEPTKSVSFKIDTVLPVTTPGLTGTGAGEWWSSDVAVALSADDGAGSGVDFVMFRVDGGTWTLYTVEFAVTGVGNHTVEFYATDLAGNEEAAVSIDVRIEDIPPETTHDLAGTLGSDDWYTTSVTVTLTATDEVGGSGIAQTYYRIGTGAWQTYTAPVVTTAQGSTNISYYSVDNAGNVEETKWVVFKIDSADPTTSHSISGAEGENGWYTGEVEVELTASDGTGASGVDNIRYRVDGGSWQTYSSPISITADGSHTIDYYATDNAGNQEETKSVTVDVDQTAPSTSASVSDSTVTLAATDADSGVARVVYRIDEGDWTNYTVPFEVTGDGNHTVEFYAVDEAGNIESTKTTYVDNGGGGILGGGAALLLVIAAIVIIAVLAAVFFLMKRKKPSAGGGAPEEPPPPPEP